MTSTSLSREVAPADHPDLSGAHAEGLGQGPFRGGGRSTLDRSGPDPNLQDGWITGT